MPRVTHHLNDMPFSNQLLLWAYRRWACDPNSQIESLTLLSHAFTLARAPNALPALDGLLTVLATSSERVIEFCGTHEQNLSDDEIRLLNLIAYQQTGYRNRVLTILSEWLPPTSIRVAGKHCAMLSRELVKARHVVCPINGEQREFRPLGSARIGHRVSDARTLLNADPLQ